MLPNLAAGVPLQRIMISMTDVTEWFPRIVSIGEFHLKKERSKNMTDF